MHRGVRTDAGGEMMEGGAVVRCIMTAGYRRQRWKAMSFWRNGHEEREISAG